MLYGWQSEPEQEDQDNIHDDYDEEAAEWNDDEQDSLGTMSQGLKLLLLVGHLAAMIPGWLLTNTAGKS